MAYITFRQVAGYIIRPLPGESDSVQSARHVTDYASSNEREGRVRWLTNFSQQRPCPNNSRQFFLNLKLLSITFVHELVILMSTTNLCRAVGRSFRRPKRVLWKSLEIFLAFAALAFHSFKGKFPQLVVYQKTSDNESASTAVEGRGHQPRQDDYILLYGFYSKRKRLVNLTYSYYFLWNFSKKSTRLENEITVKIYWKFLKKF